MVNIMSDDASYMPRAFIDGFMKFIRRTLLESNQLHN